MANIKSFPNNQDVYIGAEDVMKWLHGRTSGVFAADGNASVSALADSTMAVTVSDGLGWMANAGKDGVVWWIDNEAVNGSKLQLVIDPADGVLNRIDRIIVEWKTTNYVDYPEVKVLKGTTSSNATAPALTNNSTVRQISLAQINVAAGTTAITASMITDERLDPAVCGIVTESVKADTSVINAQFEELLERIRNNLQQITDDQILDGSITLPKLAEETIEYIDSKYAPYVTNYLDNSDFTNPVNQRGKKSYSFDASGGHAIDRWISNGAVEVVDGGVSAKSGVFRQRIEKIKKDQIYTLATEDSNGNIHIYSAIPENTEHTNGADFELYYDSTGYVTVGLKNGLTYKWAALYEGEYTAETLPKYQPKGYGAELYECMRYFQTNFIEFYASSAWSARSNIYHFNPPMRVKPSVVSNGRNTGNKNVYDYWDDSTNSYKSISGVNTSATKTDVRFTNANGLFVSGKDYSSLFEASADL